MINQELAEERGLSKGEIDAIEELHVFRDAVFYFVEAMNLHTDTVKALYNKEWMELERELQRLWGFEQDDRYIKFWEFPACSCPTMDNNDAYPYGYYSISGACVIHGNEVTKQENKYAD